MSAEIKCRSNISCRNYMEKSMNKIEFGVTVRLVCFTCLIFQAPIVILSVVRRIVLIIGSSSTKGVNVGDGAKF